MSLGLITLLERSEHLAQALSDGHITLMRFTTGWKVVLATPEMPAKAREELFDLPAHDTLSDALTDVLNRYAR